MRKNNLAKKFVAYSMAFAVAFSTITVHRNKGTYFREYTLCSEVKELYARAYGYEDFE